MGRLFVFARYCLLGLVILGFAVWGSLALWYRAPLSVDARAGVASLWSISLLIGFGCFVAGWRRSSVAFLFGLICLVLAWWSTLVPSNDRDWAPDLARTVRGSLEGNALTLRDMRNFEWRSETDFTSNWETRVFDLSKLVSLDLIADYWAGESIAHTIISFGFSDGRFIDWSIELRRDKTQSYSAIEGFFKQAELIILAGDERDLIRVRTSVRNEDLRLYRLRTTPDKIREALLTYVAEANTLAEHPQWYNTLTTNCTTVVFKIAKIVEPGITFDWRVLVSGYFPDFAYDHGALDQTITFSELRERSKISARATAASDAPSVEFSRLIRAGLPGIDTDH